MNYDDPTKGDESKVLDMNKTRCKNMATSLSNTEMKKSLMTYDL